eukprot:362622-Chlamydomonas_euryale.AAC.4
MACLLDTHPATAFLRGVFKLLSRPPMTGGRLQDPWASKTAPHKPRTAQHKPRPKRTSLP